MGIYSNREKIKKIINLIVSSDDYQAYIRRKAEERNMWCKKYHKLDLDERLEIRRAGMADKNTKLNIRRIKERHLKKLGKV